MNIKNTIFNRAKPHETTMRDRFLFRVLMPPFVLLIVIGGVGLWQLNEFLSEQAIDNLRVAARSTAIRLEREVAIRETVQKNTGEEIADIKNSYISDLADLEKNRRGCRNHYSTEFTFFNSPEGVCEFFLERLGNSRPS